LQSNDIDRAEKYFDFVLNSSKDNILALLGKACIAYHKKQYNGSLEYFTNILRLNSNCPATVRLGLAQCYWKLGNLEKAKSAFKRTLELDSKCVGALLGLAILKLNRHNAEDVKQGVSLLSKAYNIDNTNSMVLNHLANHFFFKTEYSKVELLATKAAENTDNNAIKAESYYHLAKVYHTQVI